MNKEFDKEIEDIRTAFEILEDGFNNLESKIMQEYIPEISKKGQIDEIGNTTDFLKRIEDNRNSVLKVQKNYIELLSMNNYIEEEAYEEENDKDILDVADRTAWSKENGNIRITTTRPDNSSSYPNIIPVAIFTEIVKTISDQFTRYNKEFIKTSTISSLMNDKIIKETNYKKSPNILVYSVIKVLIKEGILENKQDFKRMYVLNKKPEYIDDWLKRIC
ncbi:hypothetical protein [Clostridium oryzae]|uniref:Uncharacterized protein n=1 Tax=Clostridium oryzae TaxID=1450648 RepID=A0A1V4IRY0_9CLOT|nr:hypothetical protein [Clostridium oryzae]OPJ62565.1 hypothetical protein CLORY_16950 [Clostridium oryzae]